MGKKRKSKPKKAKPLLSEEGILHLEESFIPPSVESGLLTTVGERSSALVLAPNYGYGILMSEAIASAEAEAENQENEADGDSENSNSNNDDSMTNGNKENGETNENDQETSAKEKGMSIGKLVRAIGGAAEKPLTKKDVVEDREIEMVQVDDIESDEEEEDVQDKEQQNEFYESLGFDGPQKAKKPRLEPRVKEISKPKVTIFDEIKASETSTSISIDNNDLNLKSTTTTTILTSINDNNIDNSSCNFLDGNNIESESQKHPIPMVVENSTLDLESTTTTKEKENENKELTDTTHSIRDFYKSYTHYYHSFVPDPLSDERIEFGLEIPKAKVPEAEDSDLIALAKIAQKAKRAREMAVRLADEEKRKQKQLIEKKMKEIDFDPLPTEMIQNQKEQLGITPETTFTQYWDYVRVDPHEFERWTYLIQFAESTNNLNETRKIYSAFLPLFPYCFGYWKRYAEIEKSHHYINRALSILQRGLEFIPLSTELWISYIHLYAEINALQPQFIVKLREQYELAIRTVGMEFRSDQLWDSFIEWEMNNHKLKNVFKLYTRLLQVPTRLYNRHWDNFQEKIRDHHPRSILEKDEYERRRKKGCQTLRFKYRPEPEVEPGEIRRTSKPEDRLMTHVKERIIQRFKKVREKTETEVNKRWDFEDAITRPYYHCQPLDKRQLRNWEDYINFEISEKNHDRIVLLFERCLIACANYERYWCKYARYLENYHRLHSKDEPKISVHYQKSVINSLLISKKETEEEEAIVDACTQVVNEMIDQIEKEEFRDVNETMSNILNSVCDLVNVNEAGKEDGSSTVNVNSSTTTTVEIKKDSQEFLSAHSSSNSNINDAVVVTQKTRELSTNTNPETSVFASLLYVPSLPDCAYYWQEIVRDVYKRASIVHCPKKPAIRLQWAAFEEEIGNLEASRALIKHVLEWYPAHLEGKFQLLELERRCGNNTVLLDLYEEFISKALKSNRSDELSMFSIKYARFLYKEIGLADKALAAIRRALKKDKGNPRLYALIYEICYDRFPKDRKGALAALELALHSKDLTANDKLMFLKKKVLFLQEHGDLKKYRDTLDELYEIESKLQKEKEIEARWKAFEQRLAYENQSAQLQPFSVPSLIPSYPYPTADNGTTTTTSVVPIQFDVKDGEDLTIKSNEVKEITLEDQLREYELAREKPFGKVPPTEELAFSTSGYGYGSKHPDHKIAENMAQKEYEKIESKGYSEEIKDKPGDVVKRKPLYIVAPRRDWDFMGKPGNPGVPGSSETQIMLKEPIPLSMIPMPGSSPCVNIPEWFIKDGGELCLSDTVNGFSIIRYWPKFLSENGYTRMFRFVRKSVKWHQKQILVHGRWRHIPRLTSWLGPCDYTFSGTTLERNEDWPHEILDLLHRINRLTKHLFNSCFLNLYRSGHDSNYWHSDSNPALGANPPVASVSLGVVRTFEMRRRGRGAHNFVRFPLYPGSLLLMEGATQEDWMHQVPKEPTVKSERLNLTFRIMHALEDEDETGNGNGKEKGKEKEDGNSAKKGDENPLKSLVNLLGVKVNTGTGIQQGNANKGENSSKVEEKDKKESPTGPPTDIIEKPPSPPKNKIIFHKLLPNPRFSTKDKDRKERGSKSKWTDADDKEKDSSSNTNSPIPINENEKVTTKDSAETENIDMSIIKIEHEDINSPETFEIDDDGVICID